MLNWLEHQLWLLTTLNVILSNDTIVGVLPGSNDSLTLKAQSDSQFRLSWQSGAGMPAEQTQSLLDSFGVFTMPMPLAREHYLINASTSQPGVIHIDVENFSIARRDSLRPMLQAANLCFEASGVTILPELPMEVEQVPLITLHRPDWFEAEDFLAWLNAKDQLCMTYHQKGEAATERSNVLVWVDGDSGEGDCSDMPEHYWRAIVQSVNSVLSRARNRPVVHIPVRILNMQSS